MTTKRNPKMIKREIAKIFYENKWSKQSVKTYNQPRKKFESKKVIVTS